MTAGIKANSDGSGAIQVGGTDVIGLGTTGNINIPTSGARITGDFTNATIANRVMFQTSTVNGLTLLRAIPNGTATQANIAAANNSDPANCGFMQISATSTEAQLASGINGTGTYLPLTLYTGGSERVRLSTAGGFSVGTTSDPGAGAIIAAGNITSNSDERYKANWRSVTPNFVEKLAAVKSGVYDRTDQKATQAGVSAQSLRDVLPETVLEDASGRLSVAYGNAALVACVELAKEVLKLRAEIDSLKGVK